MSRIGVVLVLDDALTRERLRAVLDECEDIDVVGEAGNAIEAMGKLSTVSPDVVLVDVEMPHINGLETTRLLKEGGYQGAVIALSIGTERLEEALRLGAAGYLTKDVSSDELPAVIRRLPEGGLVFGASVMGSRETREIALRYIMGQGASVPHATPGAAGLAVEGSAVVEPAEGGLPAEARAEADAASEEMAVVDQPVETQHSDDSGPAPPVAESADSPTIPPHDAIMVEVELVISPPVEPTMVVRLHQWLQEVANADINQVFGSWTEDTVVRVTLRQPVPLLRLLKGLPDVAEVTEEPYTETGRTDLGMSAALSDLSPELFASSRPPTRLRLVLKGE